MDPQEKQDRQMIELLNELRVALPGVQILFAFLLTVPFAQGFQRVTDTQKGLFYATLLCTTLSTICFIAPSATHRLRFHQLLDDPGNIADHLRSYIDGYSSLARQVIEKFEFDKQIDRLKESNLLYKVIARVCDVDLWKAPLVRAGEPVAEARAKLADSEVPYPLLVDGDGRPVGWLSDRALTGERVTDDLRSRPTPVLEMEDVLRDALSDLLQEEAQYGPVVDERGSVVGVLSIEILSHALKTVPDEVPSGADAL